MLEVFCKLHPAEFSFNFLSSVSGNLGDGNLTFNKLLGPQKQNKRDEALVKIPAKIKHCGCFRVSGSVLTLTRSTHGGSFCILTDEV